MAFPDQPRLLILETSGRASQVAVAEGDSLRAVRTLDETRRHARDLAPAVAELLADQGWKPRDVHAVVVSRGPGSYTGLRVGVMSAKAFAYATGCALLALDTFLAVARQYRGDGDRLAVLADAQQGKVYVQPFARPGRDHRFEPAGPLAIQGFSDWQAMQRPPLAVSGPGLRLYQAHLRNDLLVADPADWSARAETLHTLGLERYRAGERDAAWAVEPLYLRPSSAEEKWREKRTELVPGDAVDRAGIEPAT